jgi:hypothetical protein
MLQIRPSVCRAALATAAAIALVAGLSGCGGQDDAVDATDHTPTSTSTSTSPSTDSRSAALEPGDDVPPPSGKVVLVVTGGTTTNVGDELQLDLAQLDSLASVEYDVDDHLATGERARFSGPLVQTVLELAGAEEGAVMHTAALNDYLVDVPVSDALDLPLMLATRMDGKRMSVANYGPTRFIYPTEGYGLDPVTYDPRWIWQLRSIEVE